MRAVTYGRVSSLEQVEHGTSLADQRRRLKARVLSDGNQFIAHKEDGGVSGASMDREAMNEVLEMVLRGEVDVVYATKLDRLGRTLLGVLELLEQVTTAGGHIRLIDEGIDTSTVAGRMLVQFMSVIAAFERDRIRERTVAGRVAAAESGSFVPSTSPYGYRVEGTNRERRLVIDEEEAKACRYIVTELVLGRGHSGEVAEALNAQGLRPRKARVWTAGTVRGWAREAHVLRNLSGTAVYRGIEISIPAIVTPDEAQEWARWQADPHGVNTVQRRVNKYLLSGMVFEPCGNKAHGRTTGLVTYSCRGRLSKESGHDECHNLSAPRLDAAVIGRVREILSEPTVLRAAVGGRVSVVDSPAVALTKVRAEQRDLDQEVADEVAMLREVGLRKEALMAALAPLRKRQDDLEIQARSFERQVKVAAGGSVDRVVQQAVGLLKGGYEHDDDHAMWRTVLTLIGTRVTVEGHNACRGCDGRVKIGWGQQCKSCLNGTEPIIDIEVDDALALAVSERLAVVAGA